MGASSLNYQIDSVNGSHTISDYQTITNQSLHSQQPDPLLPDLNRHSRLISIINDENSFTDRNQSSMKKSKQNYKNSSTSKHNKNKSIPFIKQHFIQARLQDQQKSPPTNKQYLQGKLQHFIRKQYVFCTFRQKQEDQLDIKSSLKKQSSIQKERMALSIERMKDKAEQIRHKSEVEHKKQLIMNKYYNQHGIQLTQKQMENKYKNIDDLHLEIILERKLRLKKQNDAAIIIQKNFKSRIARKAYLYALNVRLNATLIVQRFWLSYRRRNILPKLIIRIKNKSVLLMQSYCRGYLAYKQVQKMLIGAKFSECFNYFQEIKRKLFIDSQIKIAYAWRKYTRNKLKKLELKKKKEVEDASKKKKKKNIYTQQSIVKEKSPTSKIKSGQAPIISPLPTHSLNQGNAQFIQKNTVVANNNQKLSPISQNQKILTQSTLQITKSKAKNITSQLSEASSNTGNSLHKTSLKRLPPGKDNQSHVTSGHSTQLYIQQQKTNSNSQNSQESLLQRRNSRTEVINQSFRKKQSIVSTNSTGLNNDLEETKEIVMKFKMDGPSERASQLNQIESFKINASQQQNYEQFDYSQNNQQVDETDELDLSADDNDDDMDNENDSQDDSLVHRDGPVFEQDEPNDTEEETHQHRDSNVDQDQQNI
ncbi:myosin-partial [Stylonychia lemnae]|uniref:Myosin-partial n=1 Tax=Stylonychia lemnae TaxID=5949 RepID=A0A078ATW6_STYLE|nr:myosin-partial [Stylonychia lemnae]